MHLIVMNLAGTEICTSPTDGKKVLDAVSLALSSDEDVSLSFRGVKFLISAFLNVAIGGLYRSFDSNFLNEHLKLSDLSLEHRSLIKEVVRDAKIYYERDVDITIGSSDV